VLFVGGGDATFYALNAQTGKILRQTRLGPSPSHFLWESPTVYGGSIYTGMASFGDCPLIRSFVAKLDEQTGAIQGIFYTVPEGCVGAAVWSTPSIDPKTGHMFFDTGNVECESGAPTPELEEAMIELDTTTMALIDHWQLPPAERVADSDWGATATLFTDSSGRELVGAANKNGVFYAFDRHNLGAGPVWQHRISVGGACPQCGEAAIAPAAFDGQLLYAADGKTTIAGQDCGGSVRALRPEDGSVVWATCLVDGSGQFSPSVLGAVTATPNLITVGSGQAVVLIDNSNGAVVNRIFFDGGDNQPPPPYFWGSAPVGDGMIYAGNMSGTLVSIGMNE
jgi:outer membrane protein assembly factor BamB